MSDLVPWFLYFNLAYSTQAKVMFVGLAVIGLVGSLMARRHLMQSKRLLLLSFGVFFATLSVHALTAWVLLIDPQRDSGLVPIPAPWSAIAPWLALALNLLAPLFLGLACSLLMRAPVQRHATWWVAATAGYAVWIAPWALFKVFD